MVTKQRRKSPTARSAHTKALEENAAALARHTRQLNRSSAMLAMHATALSGVSAKQLVYSVLNEPLTLSDATPLSKLLLNPPSLAGTAAAIKAHGIKVDTGLVQACKTIADLVKVVAAAMA